jgi:hypothetical protein
MHETFTAWLHGCGLVWIRTDSGCRMRTWLELTPLPSESGSSRISDTTFWSPLMKNVDLYFLFVQCAAGDHNAILYQQVPAL